MSSPWENSLAVLELLSIVCSSSLPRGTLSTCLSDTPILGIEILEKAHKLNKPTRALNCLNTQNSGISINSHNMNKLQSALQQLDIEHP